MSVTRKAFEKTNIDAIQKVLKMTEIPVQELLFAYKKLHSDPWRPSPSTPADGGWRARGKEFSTRSSSRHLSAERMDRAFEVGRRQQMALLSTSKD